MVEFALPALPLLLLLGALLCGRYPGLDTAMRLSERIASDSRFRPVRARRPRRPRPPLRRPPAGGLLLALSLSGRAPPAAA